MTQFPSQDVLWTTIPAGIVNGRLRVIVRITPRLSPPDGQNGNLGQFPDWVDWPSTLASMTFSFQIENGPTISRDANGLLLKPKNLSREASQLWKVVFPTTGPNAVLVAITPAKDPSKKRIVSLSSQRILTAIRNVVASAPPDVPWRITDPTGDAGEGTGSKIEAQPLRNQDSDRFEERSMGMEGLSDDLEGIYDRFLRSLRSNEDGHHVRALQISVAPSDIEVLGFAAAAKDLLAVSHQPSGMATTPVAKALTVPNLPTSGNSPSDFDTAEFHALLGSFEGYPELERRLCLQLEFELTPPSQMPASGFIQAQFTREAKNQHEPNDLFPQTAYELNIHRSKFLPAPRSDSDIVGGMLDLDHEINGQRCYSIEQVDAIAEVHPTVSYYYALRRPYDDIPAAPVPTTQGITLFRNCKAERMAVALSSATDSADAIAKSEIPRFYYDNLVRGYRVDVYDGGTWKSIVERKVKASVGKIRAGLAFRDEGWISDAATMLQIPGDMTGTALLNGLHSEPACPFDADTNAIYLHDRVVNWRGWSMGVQAPSRGLKNKDSSQGSSHRIPWFRTELSVPDDSLPMLRFGATYQMRVRVVDVAGNSLAITEPTDTHSGFASRQIVFRRYESVLAPSLVEGSKPDPSPVSNANHLVIRSDYPDRLSAEIADRYVFPPLSDWKMSMFAGKLDVPCQNGTGKRLDRHAKELIKSRQASIPHEVQVPPDRIDYLPDAFCLGCQFTELPGRSGTLCLPFYREGHESQWPNPKVIRLVIEEDPTADLPMPEPKYRPPKWDLAKACLIVYLPKGESRAVDLNSLIGEAELDNLERWHEFAVADPQNRLGIQRRILLRGGHPWFNPARTVTLTHAVRQPLFAPTLIPRGNEAISVLRGAGEIAARWEAEVRLPGRTADRADVVAEWPEYVDEGPQSAPFRVSMVQESVFRVTLENSVDASQLLSGIHHFKDTKHRRVSYLVRAESRFKDHFTNASPPDAPPFTIDSEQVRVEVLSTVSPPVPTVLHGLPTFGWEDQSPTRAAQKGEIVRATVLRRVRHGGGMRIYLARPWYVTGEDELLGVVALRSGRKANDDASAWGRDATRLVGGPSQFLSEENFLGPIRGRIEIGDDLVAIGYPVVFSGEQNAWYADLVIDLADSDIPLVRLNVLRMQPFSLPTMGLSSAVRLDSVELMPTRTLEADFSFDQPTKISNLRLRGPSLSRSSIVTAQVETGYSSPPTVRLPEHPEPADIEEKFSWVAEGDAVELTYDSQGPIVQWSTSAVSLPLAGRPTRVVVTERQPRLAYDPDKKQGEAIDTPRVVYSGALYL